MNVREMQRRLSHRAEQEAGHRFGDLYNLLYDMTWLREAHRGVSQNAGKMTAGCDGITMTLFDEHLDTNLATLREELRAGTFTPQPVRRVFIPKGNGRQRALGIPSIRDRIVQEALRMLLEPIFEADFSPRSYGFRPGRCTMDAVAYVAATATGHQRYYWIIEGDIASYFDTINHRKLLKLVAKRIRDKHVLTLLWKFLKAGIMEGKLFRDTRTGTPQGGIISPLLANIYLHSLDRYLTRYTALSEYRKYRRRLHGQANFLYARYADDFVVLCNGTKRQAEAMREEVQHFLSAELKLTLSMEKTKITHLNDGYEFLGFELARGIGQSGKLVPRIRIPRDAMQTFTEKISRMTRRTQDSTELKILALNRVIEGWGRYYQYTSSPRQIFADLDNEVFWQMAHWLGQKYRLSIPRVLRRFYRQGRFWWQDRSLKKLTDCHTAHYPKKQLSNPYTLSRAIPPREELVGNAWTGYEERANWRELRASILQRDTCQCQGCGKQLTEWTAEVDHRRPQRRYLHPQAADFPENLQTLCHACHVNKTQVDRQRESPVQ